MGGGVYVKQLLNIQHMIKYIPKGWWWKKYFKKYRKLKQNCEIILNNSMTKETFKQFLDTHGIIYSKIRFSKQSKYQKNNYKSEFVGWEAWIYQNESSIGYCITQEGYEEAKKFNNYDFLLDSLK